jgi:hypothetical protein
MASHISWDEPFQEQPLYWFPTALHPVTYIYGTIDTSSRR